MAKAPVKESIIFQGPVTSLAVQSKINSWDTYGCWDKDVEKEPIKAGDEEFTVKM